MKRWVFGVIIAALFVQAGYCEVTVSNSFSFGSKERFFLPGKDLIYIKAFLPDENKDNARVENIVFKLLSAQGGDTEDVALTETGLDTGCFQVSNGIAISPQVKILNDGIMQVSASQDAVTVMSKDGRVFAVLAILPAIESFSINTEPVQTAGKPFSVEVVARDMRGDVLANYAGTVDLGLELVSAGKAADKVYAYKVNSFVNGKANSSIVYPDAGKIRIIARDANNKEGQSSEILSMPARLKVENASLGTVGKEFSLKVTALNFNNEITYGYKGPAAIKLLKGDGFLGGDILFNRGQAEAKVIYNKWGEMKFVVYDKQDDGIRGISSSVLFNPQNFEVKTAQPPKDRKKFYFEELFKGVVSPLDYHGNKILNYGGVAIIEPVDGVDMPDRLYFGWQDKGEDYFYASGITEKPFKVKVHDAPFPEIKGESGLISFTPASVKLELANKKNNKADIRVRIEDAKGSVISGDNSTIFTVHLIESNPNDSASLIGTKQVTAKNGLAVITLIDKEKETVTVAPESEPYLEIIPLEVSFE